MSEIKTLKFTAEKFSDFSIAGDFEQLCNLCGCTGAEMAPEVEFINKKELKSFCLSIFCSSKECRNLAYHYFEMDTTLQATIGIEEFTSLPKGLKFTCNKCGSQEIQVTVALGQSGFKYIYDLVEVTLSCSCGNHAKNQFLGKYF